MISDQKSSESRDKFTLQLASQIKSQFTLQLNNIHRTFAMKDGDDFESKYLNLKAYFRQRLTQMLSVVGKEAPSGHSKINTTTTPAPTQEKAPVGDLQALIQLFKTEANNS